MEKKYERLYKCGDCKKVFFYGTPPKQCENCGGDLFTYEEYYGEVAFEGFKEPLEYDYDDYDKEENEEE